MKNNSRRRATPFLTALNDGVSLEFEDEQLEKEIVDLFQKVDNLAEKDVEIAVIKLRDNIIKHCETLDTEYKEFYLKTKAKL